jgi:hypothetical protein
VQISPVNAGDAAADYAVDLADPVAPDQSAQPLAGHQRFRRWQAALAGPIAWPVAVYAASRLLLLLVTSALALAGQPFTREPFRFDARWYLLLAERGYPTVPLHAKSTLGFFPLYPLVLRGLGWMLLLPVSLAALVT